MDGILRTLRHEATDFWPVWLFALARMAHVQSILSRRLYIGTEGTAEDGKSEVLTVLTATLEEVSSSGTKLCSRTINTQMYGPETLSTIYLDCARCHDQNGQV